MADVMDAFARGHALGQATVAHQQALEDNKIRQMVLQHQLAALKIDDQIRQRDLARQNLDFMQGQPASEIPSETVTTDQSNLDSTSLAGMVKGLVTGGTPQQMVHDSGAPVLGPQPETVPAPAAQATAPGTNPVSVTRARAMDIPGVPGLGVSGVSVRPRSMEDLIRAEVQKKYAEAQFAKLAPGEVIPALGTAPPAGPAYRAVGAGGLAATGPDGPSLVIPGRATTAKTWTAVNGHMIDNTTHKDLGVIPKQIDPEAAASRAEQQAWQRDFAEYSQATSVAQKKHAEQVRAIVEGNKAAEPGMEQEIPDFTPPSFEEWRAQNGRTGAPAAKGKGQAPKPAAGAGVDVPYNNRVWHFPTQQAADGFKKEMGIP